MDNNNSSTMISNIVNEGGDTFIIEIDEMLDELKPPCEHCIYRVPMDIRKVNEEAYTPRIVSIGPFHHNKKNLKSMEQFKKRYMKKLVRRNRKSSLKECTDFVTENEANIRDCYSEDIDMDSKEFRKMILVDSCFIIQFLIYVHNNWEEFDCSLYIKPMMMNNLTFDLILLENQVPFFVLKKLCRLTTSKEFSMFDLAPNFLKKAVNLHLFEGFKDKNCSELKHQSIMHFTHLFLILHRPPVQEPWKMQNKNFQTLRSSTELTQAGVKFKEMKTNSDSFNITFSNGVLEMPRFLLTKHIEIQIRNLMAAELLLLNEKVSFVTDYFLLMDCLINTTKDVKLLVDKKIITNHFGDNNEAADFINKLCINVPCYSYGFHFSQVYEQLNNYYDGTKAKLKRNYIHTLKRDYCHTPWKTTATIAAIMLLVLTLIQTVFSIISPSRDK